MPPTIADVITPRLALLPMTLSSVLVAQQGEAALAKSLGRACADGCLDPSFQRVLADLAACLAEDAGLAAWNRWTAEAGTGRVIGTIGFLTRPDEHGMLELGYSISPGEQNRGYATEAVRGLLDFAFAQRGVRMVQALCREDNVASSKVLYKNGFRRIEELGPMWSWELTPADRQAEKRDE